MRPDPLIDEVRKARHEISRECGHDIRKLCARYQAMEKQMKAEGKAQFVSRPLAGRTHDLPAATVDLPQVPEGPLAAVGGTRHTKN